MIPVIVLFGALIGLCLFGWWGLVLGAIVAGLGLVSLEVVHEAVEWFLHD